MRHVQRSIFFLFLVLWLPGLVFTQIVEPAKANPVIENLIHEVRCGKLFINFSIEDNGVIEFGLFGAEKKKIWFNLYEKLIGENEIKINLKPLEEGETYAFNLKFKGKSYDGEFIAEKDESGCGEEVEEYEEYEEYDWDDEYEEDDSEDDDYWDY